jgi:hypothetical protein
MWNEHMLVRTRHYTQRCKQIKICWDIKKHFRNLCTTVILAASSLKFIEFELVLRKRSDVLNSVAWVQERSIPTERPPLIGEINANFCGYRMPSGQRDGSPLPYSRFSRSELLLFLPSRSSIVLTRLWTPFQTHYFSENLVVTGIEPGTSGPAARNSDY